MADSNRPIYLDYNATTPVLPRVADAMRPYLREQFGNPSSGHLYGRDASRAVDLARSRVADLIGAEPERIVFTSGGTESNNLALRGLTRAVNDLDRIVTSAIEHSSVEQTCRYLEESGYATERLNVDSAGQIRPEQLELTSSASPSLVTVMHANNETGVLQPIEQLSDMANRDGVYIHTDAAQTVGKIPVDVDRLGVDLLSIAGHKLYAPKGVGALYIREGTPLEPLLEGASHENGLRPGTENVASIVGLGEACRIAGESLESEADRVEKLRQMLWRELNERVPGIELNGHPEQRLPNTLNVSFPDVTGPDLLAETPGVAASTGSACHEGEGAEISSVLDAMGLDRRRALGAVRLSLGRFSSERDVKRATNKLGRRVVEGS